MKLAKNVCKIYSAHAKDGSVGIFSSNDMVIDPKGDSLLGVFKDGYYLIPEGEVAGEEFQTVLGNGVKAKLIYEYSYYDEDTDTRYTTLRASTTGVPSENDYDVLGNLDVEPPVEVISTGISPRDPGHIGFDFSQWQLIPIYLNNVIPSSSNINGAEDGGTRVLTFTAKPGYELPDTITAYYCDKRDSSWNNEKADYTWDKATGTLTFRNVTGNIYFRIEANYKTYNVNINIGNIAVVSLSATGTKKSDKLWVSKMNAIQPFTIIFEASSGYSLPDNVTVTGCKYEWNKSTGKIILTNPTEDVKVTINGVAQSFNIKVVTSTMVAGSSNKTTIKAGESVTLYFEPSGYYLYPTSVTVTGAEGSCSSNGAVYLKNATSDVTVTFNSTKVGIRKGSTIKFNDKLTVPSSNIDVYAQARLTDSSYSNYYIYNIYCSKSNGILTYSTDRDMMDDYLGAGGDVYAGKTGLTYTTTGTTYSAYTWILPAAKEIKLDYTADLELTQTELNWFTANATIS